MKKDVQQMVLDLRKVDEAIREEFPNVADLINGAADLLQETALRAKDWEKVATANMDACVDVRLEIKDYRACTEKLIDAWEHFKDPADFGPFMERLIEVYTNGKVK